MKIGKTVFNTLITLFLSLSLGFAYAADQPLTLTLKFYNLTSQPHQITANKSAGFGETRGMNIEPKKIPKVVADASKPVIIKHNIREIGRMYRVNYQIKDKQLACVVDFIVWWNSTLGRYQVANLHASGSGGKLCALSPVKIDYDKKTATFTVALAEKPA